MADKTLKIFDASLQKEVDHTLTTDATGEIIATSVDSGRVLKFPAGTGVGELKTLIGEHKEANEGQEVISPELLQAQAEAIERSQETVEAV